MVQNQLIQLFKDHSYWNAFETWYFPDKPKFISPIENQNCLQSFLIVGEERGSVVINCFGRIFNLICGFSSRHDLNFSWLIRFRGQNSSA